MLDNNYTKYIDRFYFILHNIAFTILFLNIFDNDTKMLVFKLEINQNNQKQNPYDTKF